MKYLYWLLIFIPVTVVAAFVIHMDDGFVFIFCCLGIVPLAAVLGDATEQISYYTGPKIGGFLNATMGNVPEILISGFAIRAGMHSLVLASLAGSVFGNILLVTGMSILFGGFKFKFLTFNTHITHNNFSLLAFAAFALALPFFFTLSHPGTAGSPTAKTFSLVIAIIMISLYLIGLIFSLFTHRDIFLSEDDEDDDEVAEWSLKKGLIIMALAAAAVALMSEILVDTVEGAAEKFGFGEAFVGIILIPILGNVAEHASAIIMALREKLDISIEIAVGSSMQISLFVLPLMVVVSAFTNNILELSLTPMEMLCYVLSVGVSYILFTHKKVNWLEGAILVTCYICLAVAFLIFGV